MKQFEIARDKTSIATYMIEMTDSGYTASLAADTDTTVAVPADALKAIVSASDHFYISGAAITLPTTGGGFGAANAELNKDAIVINGETTLHIRSRNICDVSISFWR